MEESTNAGVASSVVGGVTRPGAWDAVGVGNGSTVVFVDVAAFCVGCVGGADETGRGGVCGGVGAGGAVWTGCVGTASDVGAVWAEGICAGMGADSTTGVDSAGGAG